MTKGKTFQKRTATHLHPLTLNKALGVRQYPQHDVFDGGLLLEYHPGQVQQHLVALYLQLGLLVEVSVPEADSAELEVTGEHFLVRFAEGLVAHLIYNLQSKSKVSKSELEVPQGPYLRPL